MDGMSSSPPSWVQDAIFYQIFPDRFARSARVHKPSGLEPWGSPPTVHGYKGGDLLGVEEKLDWLADLGVTALYFTPIFQSASNHRYHTHDYFRVDPMLGGNDAFRTLVDSIHERGMRVILDGVFNHASRGFFRFSDVLENGPKSAYLDWFHVRKFPLNAYEDGPLGYEAWWNLPALPKFNTATPAVREFLWSVAETWLRAGVDGWRLDVPNEIDDDSFWQEFRRRCRAVNPECYIVGEIWGSADRWLQGDQFDAVMNYPFTRATFGLVAEELNEREIAKSGYVKIPRLDAAGFAREARGLVSRHPPAVVRSQLNLLGSHDTPRALSLLCDDGEALKMALTLLMTFPGAPCIYYGDEIGLTGGHDPYCRGTIPWDEEQVWDHELRAYLRKLIELRKENPALRRGDLEVIHARGNLLLLARQHEANRVIIAVNSGRRQLPLGLEVGGEAPEGRYRDPQSGLELGIADGTVSGFDVPPRKAIVYVSQ